MALDQSKINIILPVEKGSISLSVFDSDSITNSVVLEQVVGTLVKYSGVGRYTPYLAKKWIVSDDQKTWTFEFHPGLRTEDGIEINAYTYSENLKKLLRIYSNTYSPPCFNKIIGWQEFSRGDLDRLSIKATSDLLLEMNFSEVPSGLLEFLSMSYFGFYSEHNFIGDEWKDNKSIISSGSYKLVSYSDDEIVLSLRKDWPLMAGVEEKSIQNIIVQSAPWKEVIKKEGNYIIRIDNSNDAVPENYLKMNSTPTMLGAIVMSPYIKPFDDIKVRKAMRVVFREKMKQFDLPNPTSVKTNHFYQGFSPFSISEDDYVQALKYLRGLKVKKFSTFQMANAKSSNSFYLSKVFTETLKEVGWEVHHDDMDTLGNEWFKKGLDNKLYALRTAGVDIGGNPENWVIEMMFCSRLGISFPDADNKICEVVKKFSNGEFTRNEDYWLAIHEAIEESSTVVPAIHSGYSWLISPTIDLKNVSSSMNVPRVDEISLKL